MGRRARCLPPAAGPPAQPQPWASSSEPLTGTTRLALGHRPRLFHIGYWTSAIQRNQIPGRHASESERPSWVGVVIEVGVHQRQQHPPFTTHREAGPPGRGRGGVRIGWLPSPRTSCDAPPAPDGPGSSGLLAGGSGPVDPELLAERGDVVADGGKEVRGVDGSGQLVPLDLGPDRDLQLREDQADPRALRCSSSSSSMADSRLLAEHGVGSPPHLLTHLAELIAHHPTRSHRHTR